MNIKKILNAPKKVVSNLISKSGFRILKEDKYEILATAGILEVLHRWTQSECPRETREFVIRNLFSSKSQIQQDLWALHHYINKHNSEGRNGFFVEFGATDGILRSNTYLLEKQFGWQGILCEPARTYQDSLKTNRSVRIDTRCVFSETGKKVAFHEVGSSELSGISDYKHIGGWEEERKNFREYKVETVSLDDLLTQNSAPNNINYISIDTEGSEFEILKSFPFEKWNIDCFSIEHNYSENEEFLDELLSNHGYKRVLSQVSGFDGWYIKKEITPTI